MSLRNDDLIIELKKAAQCIYIACESSVAKDISDLLQQAAAALKEPDGWISVETLPSEPTVKFHGGPEGSCGCLVILFCHKWSSKLVYFDTDDSCFWDGGRKATGTHWMPLPEAPNEL